ncbi:hypothetical protein BGZ75_009624 [Mortierella antarctica]|nr:hypothetical protein BGZ75_009624 [Mortierella antarctica]
MSNINSNNTNVQDGAQVELMDTLQPQQHPPPSQQQQPSVPQQFQPQYQQSFFTQPDIPEPQGRGGGGGYPTQDQSYDPSRAVPSNTNAIGDGTPGYHVGGVGLPGSRVELMPQQQQPGFESGMRPASPQPVPGSDALTGGQLDSVQHASASRPLVGPFDAEPSQQPPLPPQHPFSSANTSGVSSFTASQIPSSGGTLEAAQSTAPLPPPPSIHLQREASAQGNDLPRSSQGMMGTAGSGNNNSMSPTASSTSPETPNKVHIASEGAIAAAQANQAATARGRRRSSLAVLVDKIKSASRSRSRSTSLSRRLSRTLSRHSLDEEEEEAAAGGPYKDVKLAQKEYLAKLRAEQERMGITHNADGLPIPQPEERQRRRSSVSHILGLDKPLLSR